MTLSSISTASVSSPLRTSRRRSTAKATRLLTWSSPVRQEWFKLFGLTATATDTEIWDIMLTDATVSDENEPTGIRALVDTIASKGYLVLQALYEGRKRDTRD